MLSKLNCEALNRYGMNMGDVLDLLDLVEKKVTQAERNPTIPVVTQQTLRKEANATADSIKVGPSSGLLPGCSSNFTVGASTSSSSQSFENLNDDSESINCGSASAYHSDNGMDQSVQSVHDSNDSDDSAVESSDETFIGFATRDEIRKVKNYDRKVFRNLINKYKYFKSQERGPNKILLPKPTLKSVLSPERKKSEAKGSSSKNDKENEIPDSKKRKAKLQKKSSKKICNNVEKATLREEHKAFLDCAKLTVLEKSQIKEFLQNKLNPTFSISEMLSSEAKTSKDIKEVEEKLKKDGVVFLQDCKKFVEALMESLYAKTDNINLVTASMREGLAACVVATYPKMAHLSLLPDDKPWSWLYDRKNNKGKFANYHAHKQGTSDCPRMRSGGSSNKSKSKQNSKEPDAVVMFAHINDLKLSKDALYLKMLLPDDRNRDEIERYLKSTFKERRLLVLDPRCPVRLLLEGYPKLADFEGRMIDFEFDMMFPDKGALLVKNFQDLVPRLLKIAEDDEEKYPPRECMRFNDMALNSLIILSKFLPKPKRVNADTWETSMNPLPQLEDFFHVVPVGSDLTDLVTHKRVDQNAPVQPYILATGSPKKLERLTLVLGDSKLIMLPLATMPLKAVDLLIKSNYVFNTHFYLGWKYVMRFLAFNIFTIPPDNQRHSTFSEHFKQLMEPL